MSRRRPKGELQFGSDSFLDVVANIVGILIILIVIAGLRVSQTPVVIATAKPNPIEPEPLPVASSIPVLPDPVETAVDPPLLVLLEPANSPIEEKALEPPLPPLPPLIVPPELADLARRLESEIATLTDEEVALAAKLASSVQLQSSLLEKHRSIRSLLAEKTVELDATKKQAAAAELDMELARETLSRLAKQVRELENIPANVETLEHRITPISRVVNGNEKHYRLEHNRVVEVPLEELAGRFKHQLDRRKEWLAKTRQHQGQIGPVDGFTMRYLVKVDSMSDLDAARFGHGGFRIYLARYEIVPEPDTKGELEEVALRKGSRFYQSILGTAPDTTLTFWVYPDSYAIFHKLQKFAHEHGYSVAGRPLPNGVHIAGSPDGSKSASQ